MGNRDWNLVFIAAAKHRMEINLNIFAQSDLLASLSEMSNVTAAGVRWFSAWLTMSESNILNCFCSLFYILLVFFCLQ